MKSFSSTPDFDQLPVASVIELIRGAEIDDHDYLHWEQIRYRTPPPGLSNLEWWLRLKLTRRAGVRELPELLAINQKPAQLSRHSRIDAALARIDRGLGVLAMTDDQPFSAQTRDQYLVSSLMEEAIHSSIFEGAVSTRQVAKDMLRDARAPLSRDEQMILNNYRAMQRIRELRDHNLSVDLVLELHRILTEGTLDDEDQAGRFQRSDEVRVNVVDHRLHRVVYSPPRADELPRRLEALIGFANANDTDDRRYLHPVLRAILLHFQLAYDHPFADGNGRTARALFYWAMLRNGYWLTEFISISRPLIRKRSDYERAYLFVESDHQNVTYFVLQQLQVIEIAIAELQDYVRIKQAEQQQLSDALRRDLDLNVRQRALLAHALRNPEAVYTHESHGNSHQISVPTARADLLSLVDAKLLTLARRGKRIVYRPARQLELRIRGKKR